MAEALRNLVAGEKVRVIHYSGLVRTATYLHQLNDSDFHYVNTLPGMAAHLGKELRDRSDIFALDEGERLRKELDMVAARAIHEADELKPQLQTA